MSVLLNTDWISDILAAAVNNTEREKMLNDSNKTYTGQDTTAAPSQTLKLGTHRGNRRIWLDHSEYLSGAGFLPGARYNANYNAPGNFGGNGMIVLNLHPEGKTKVSKKTKGGKLHPVIDMNSKKNRRSVSGR